MSRQLLICCTLLGALLLSGSSIAADTIYRTVDEEGNVMFTDDPKRGGEAVDLKPLTTMPSLDTPNAGFSLSPSSSRSSRADVFASYTRFSIASPANGMTLPNGQAGDVGVQLAIEPSLHQGHRVQLLVDGQLHQSSQRGDTFLLRGLERGKHRVRAELLSADGRVLKSTAPITLYVKRASANLPQNPNNPNAPNRPVKPVSGISGAPSISGAGVSNQ